MLNGIVLAGGLSSRYGSCKSELMLDDTRLLRRSYGILSRYCSSVSISCREEQTIRGDYDLLFDLYRTFSPMAGIYTGLHHFKSPLLVLSCDLAFIDEVTIENLIEARNSAKLANPKLFMTCYKVVKLDKPEKSLEPLIAIYEYEALATLKKSIESGLYSLHRALDLANSHIIQSDDPKPFFNVNTVEDLKMAEQMSLL